MDLHQRQQFDFLLLTATERFVARLEERHRGAAPALAALAEAGADGVLSREFVNAIFQDFLLDNADGAAFVLRSLPRRSLAGHREAIATAEDVEKLLVELAKSLFAELLHAKSLEALEHHSP